MAERAKVKKSGDLKRLLKAQLDLTVARLQKQAEVPQGSAASGDFLDVAQSVEHQELAWLGASRPAEPAKRLRIAWSRVAEGEASASNVSPPSRPSVFSPSLTPPRAWRVRNGWNASTVGLPTPATA